MKFLSLPEMLSILPDQWGAERAEDRDIIRAAIERRPGQMRRIHDLVALTRPAFETEPFLYRKLGVKTPIEYLREGSDGILTLDAMLVRIFQQAAPRDIFDVPGEGPRPELEGVVILNLLWARDGAIPGASSEIFDPLRMDLKLLADGERRLAAAIMHYLQREDSDLARRILMVALRDDAKIVRCAALATSGWMSGFRDVVQLIAGMRSDPEVDVRVAAAGALGMRAEMPEITGELAEFTYDEEPAVRLAALRPFLNKQMPPGSMAPLAHTAFDIDEKVRQVADMVVPEEEVMAYVRRLAKAAHAGDRLEERDLRIIAASTYLLDNEKVRVFSGRIVALSQREGTDDEYAMILRSLSSWDGGPTDELLQMLGVMPPIVGNENLIAAVDFVVRTCGTPAAWPMLDAFLRMPVNDRNYGHQANIAGTVGYMAKQIPEFREGLVKIAEDSGVNDAARKAAMYGMSRFGVDLGIANRMKAIAMSSSAPDKVAKQAALTAVNLLRHSELGEMLRDLATSQVAVVRDYAVESLREIINGDFSTSPEMGSARRAAPERQDGGDKKIVDIQQARERRAKRLKKPVDTERE